MGTLRSTLITTPFTANDILCIFNLVFQDLQQQIYQKDEEMRVLDSAKREKEVQLNQLNKQKVRLNPFIQRLLVCNQKLVYSNGCFVCLQSVGPIVTVFHCCDYHPQTKLVGRCGRHPAWADTPPLGRLPPGRHTPLGRPPTPTATAADGTHPTEMHSYLQFIFLNFLSF